MRKKFTLLILMVLCLGLISPPLTAQAKNERHPHQHCNWHEILQLKNGMRKLWIDHVWWTRDYVKSNLEGLEDQEKVLARLMKNQENIGNLIKPYYGEDAGNKLTALLKDHIAIAGQLVDAAKMVMRPISKD